MIGRTRLLVDLRDNENMRGFHVLASLYLIADRLQSVELYRLGGDTPEEKIALQSFFFDTGIRFYRIRRLILVDSKFDICVAAANELPWDAASVAARKTSRRTIVALMFGSDTINPPVNCSVLSGHDTHEMSNKVITELQQAAEH